MLDLTDLPAEIVPAVEASANGVAAHVRSKRDASVEVHEQGALEAWRAEAGAVLARVVSAATTARTPGAPSAERVSALWRWAVCPALTSTTQSNREGVAYWASGLEPGASRGRLRAGPS